MPELTIDWIALTYPDPVSLEDTNNIFEGSWIPLEHGGNGYLRATQNGHIVVLFEGNPGMGHHLRLSSHALRQIEGQSDFPGWPQWLKQEFQRGAKPTRIDLAFDDHEGYLDFPTIVDHLRRRALTTRYKSWGHTQNHKFDLQDDKPEAEIIRLGSRTSTTYLRIYDRAARLSLPGHLIRFEIECKKRAALRVACEIASAQGDTALGALAVGILKSLVEFRVRVPDDDTNASRAPIASWWSNFCGAAEKLKLGLGHPIRTIEKTKHWLHRQAAPSIATVIIAMQAQGESAEDWLANVISSGGNRLSTVHKQMIQDAQCRMRPRMTVRGRGEPEADLDAEDPEAGGVDRGGDDDDQ